MEITDIKIRKTLSDGKLRAIVSVTFDNALAVHDIKVIEGQGREFVAMPSRKSMDGTYRDIVHPINSEFREELEGIILRTYHENIENAENQLDDLDSR